MKHYSHAFHERCMRGAWASIFCSYSFFLYSLPMSYLNFNRCILMVWDIQVTSHLRTKLVFGLTTVYTSTFIIFSTCDNKIRVIDVKVRNIILKACLRDTDCRRLNTRVAKNVLESMQLIFRYLAFTCSPENPCCIGSLQGNVWHVRPVMNFCQCLISQDLLIKSLYSLGIIHAS